MKKQVRGRKVRIIVSDPYATDDSSSDEWFECKPPKVKRIVREINLPFQLSDCVKTSRRKAYMQLNKPVGVRLRQSGKWAAEIRNPITKTKVWLGTYETLEEAGKAYADKKLEFDALSSSGTDVSSMNSQCLRSAASGPCANGGGEMCKEKESLSKDVAASSDLTKEGFDLSGLEIPDLSFLATEVKSTVSGANGGEIDFDWFSMDEDYGHLFDDFSVLDNGNNISVASELPECDFTDVGLEHADMKFALAEQLAPPLNICCP